VTKERALPTLTIVRRVTRRHGEVFAQGWLEVCRGNRSIFEAFEDSGVIEWPEGGLLDPRQARYQDIEDEILEQTFAAVRSAVADAFVKVAREITARERQRQRSRNPRER
jgi:hypothetical protein